MVGKAVVERRLRYGSHTAISPRPRFGPGVIGNRSEVYLFFRNGFAGVGVIKAPTLRRSGFDAVEQVGAN